MDTLKKTLITLLIDYRQKAQQFLLKNLGVDRVDLKAGEEFPETILLVLDISRHGDKL